MQNTMHAESSSKDERLYIRMSAAQKTAISKAARVRHQSVSQFVIQATLDAAEAVLTDETVFTLTPEQWSDFNQRLDEPAKVIPELQQLHSEMTNG